MENLATPESEGEPEGILSPSWNEYPNLTPIFVRLFVVTYGHGLKKETEALTCSGRGLPSQYG